MEIVLDQIALHYEAHGEGRPLLFLPGWTMTAATFAHIIEPLLPGGSGWQRIYLDPPGHGRTPGPAAIHNLDQMVDVLLAAIDQIVAGRPFALAGYSAGAYLARAILRRRPAAVTGLAMLAPLVVPDDRLRDVPAHQVLLEDPQVMASLSPAEQEMMAIVVVRDAAILATMRGWPLLPPAAQSDFDYLQAIREDPLGYTCAGDVDDLEEPFARPALIVAGRQDSVVGYADAWRLLDNYPRATFAVLDRTGHLLEGQEELLAALLADWLERVAEVP